MYKHPGLVDSPEAIQEIAEHLKTKETIAFDTEFVRERTFFPILEIIQVASDTDSWLVDAQAFRKTGGKGLEPLFEVFQNPNILKFAHAAQNDQECIYCTFNVLAAPLFDTALAAALCGYGDSIGLRNLLRSVLRVKLPKGHARTHWSMRPLPKPLQDYAHADVTHLVELGERLIEILQDLGRDQWAFALSKPLAEPRLYETNPKQIADRLAKSGRISPKEYPILLELIEWREQRVREMDVPRKRLADDSTLMDLANVKPKTLEHLLAFRGIPKHELQENGERILEAIQRGLNGDVPRFENQAPPTTEESRTITLLRCFIDMLADRYNVATRHLIDSSQYLALLRENFETPQELVEEGILSQPAADLIGQDLISLVGGKTSITIQDGKVVLTHHSKSALST